MGINHLQKMKTFYRIVGKIESAQSISDVIEIMDNLPDQLTDAELSKLESISKEVIETFILALQT